VRPSARRPGPPPILFALGNSRGRAYSFCPPFTLTAFFRVCHSLLHGLNDRRRKTGMPPGTFDPYPKTRPANAGRNDHGQSDKDKNKLHGPADSHGVTFSDFSRCRFLPAIITFYLASMEKLHGVMYRSLYMSCSSRLKNILYQ